MVPLDHISGICALIVKFANKRGKKRVKYLGNQVSRNRVTDSEIREGFLERRYESVGRDMGNAMFPANQIRNRRFPGERTSADDYPWFFFHAYMKRKIT